MAEWTTFLASHFQEWLRAKLNINTEVPAVAAWVKELLDRTR